MKFANGGVRGVCQLTSEAPLLTHFLFKIFMTMKKLKRRAKTHHLCLLLTCHYQSFEFIFLLDSLIYSSVVHFEFLGVL